MIASCRSTLLAACFCAVLLATPSRAQYGAGAAEAQPNNYPPALPDRHGPALKLIFEVDGEIPLPGPLGAPSAWLLGDLVAVPVAGGVAQVKAEVGATPEIDPGNLSQPPSGWITAPSGKRRYRTTPEGIVEAQRFSSVTKRWVRRWKIVAPNSLLAPPTLIGPRLCYAGLDDRVTCVRASNGHRLWAVDLGDRISRPIACWPFATRGDQAVEGEVLLVVPDDGASLIAVDAYDGSRITTYQLPASKRFASAAMVLSGDRIAVARKGYDDHDAALLLLRLATAPKPVDPPAVPYNGASPVPAGSPGR